MKSAIALGMAALLVTAGAAVADGPTVLSNAQLEQVTAGSAYPTGIEIWVRIENPGMEHEMVHLIPQSRAEVDRQLEMHRELPDGRNAGLFHWVHDTAQ